jgi:hypothetical protein
MKESLKCFISYSHDIDVSSLKNVLGEYDIESFDLYDFSIGESIQQILKRKIRQADFAIFVIPASNNANVLYEMGVCEGLGKIYFTFLEKGARVPFYLESQLFFQVDLEDRKPLKAAVENILQTIENTRSGKTVLSKKPKIASYDSDILANLESYSEQIKQIRVAGTAQELEHLVAEIFKTIRINYIENVNDKDSGIDFMFWNDNLGKVIGNPILVELKYGNLSDRDIAKTDAQLSQYIMKAEARVALFLYLDKGGKRFKIKSSLLPLIITYDIEDFVTELKRHSLEKLILAQRNKIAHGIENG